MQKISLKDIQIGGSARIVGYNPTHPGYRAKLLSMGLTKGITLLVENIAPMGDPVVVQVRDFQLSLRKKEADALILESIS